MDKPKEHFLLNPNSIGTVSFSLKSFLPLVVIPHFWFFSYSG